MRGMRFSRFASLALATIAMGLWVVGCSNGESTKLLLPPHGDQATPSGAYSIAWSGVEVSGSGRIVVPGELDLVLSPAQVKDLAHSLFNINATGHHGWGVAPLSDANGDLWIVVDPHPHEAATLRLSYDPQTGRAEGHSPVALKAPSAALNTLMKAFLTRTTGIKNPQDVTALKLEIAAVSYSFHWNPNAREFQPAENAYPALMANGVTIEGVFYVGETPGNFSATIDRMNGDASGAQVAECPECALVGGTPGHQLPVSADP
jgi:hypothetical protein